MMKRLMSGVLAFALILTLAACGDDEPTQRKSFISFLQTRILDKPGVHVPQLTPDETKSFGRYGAQYAVITDFHKVMNESVSPKLTAAMSQGTIQSLGDLAARTNALEAAKATMKGMATALDADLQRTEEARAKLDQPADVKAVFDKVYDRLVMTPAATLRSVAPVADRALADALDLAATLNARKGQITISGATIQASSAAVRDELNAKMSKLQASQRAVQAAQTAMRTLIYGQRP